MNKTVRVGAIQEIHYLQRLGSVLARVRYSRKKDLLVSEAFESLITLWILLLWLSSGSVLKVVNKLQSQRKPGDPPGNVERKTGR